MSANAIDASGQPETRPAPSGAPRTGGGRLGMRDPLLVSAGIALLLAALGLVLVRMWPSVKRD